MTPIKPVSNPHVCRILAAAWAALPTEETYAMLAKARELGWLVPPALAAKFT